MHPSKMRLLWGIQWLRHPLHFQQERGAIATVSVGLIAFAILGLRVPTALAQLTPAQSFRVAQNELDINLSFVNPATGDDNNGNGKADAPFKTITQALQVAQPNTVILLAPGIYSAETGESFPLILKPGVTIQGNSRTRGQTIEIRGGGTFESSTAKSQTITILGADQATLTGVTITNPNPAGYGLWIESSSPVVVDNTFTGNSNAGIVIKGNSAPTIRSNYFYNNGGKGIIADGTLQADVRENVFEGTENAALQLISDRQTPPPSTEPSTNPSSEVDDTPIASGNSPTTETESNLAEGANGESNPQIPFPSAEIKQPETRLQNIPLDGLENNLSISGVDSTTSGEANNPLDSVPAALETTANSQPDNSTPPDSTANSSTQNEVIESPLGNSITAASFPVPSSLKPKPSTSRVEVSSTPATSNSANEQPTPQTPVVNESNVSPPTAAIAAQEPSQNSPQTPSELETPQTESVEISVPQPESAAVPPTTSEPTSEESSVMASSQSNSVENSVPVLNSTNPLADSGAEQIATVGGQRYRVLVEVKSDSQQELVRSLVPGAFRTSLDGQTLMQAGLFSTRENAEKVLQLLDSKGLNATIEPLN